MTLTVIGMSALGIWHCLTECVLCLSLQIYSGNLLKFWNRDAAKRKKSGPDGIAEWVEHLSPILVDHEIKIYGRVKLTT